MEAIKLSMEDLFIKWSTFCVDWFMNMFADPEYYWVEETYPNRVTATSAKKTVVVEHKQKWIKDTLRFKEGMVYPVLLTKKLFKDATRLPWRISQYRYMILSPYLNIGLKYPSINI